MSAQPVDVLAGELRITRTEYTPGITTTIAEAVMDCPAGTYWIIPDEARAAVAELVEAVKDLSRDGTASEAEWARVDASLARVQGPQ